METDKLQCKHSGLIVAACKSTDLCDCFDDGGNICHCERPADAYEKGYLAESPAGWGQCLDCALNRCDAFPGTCPNRTKENSNG